MTRRIPVPPVDGAPHAPRASRRRLLRDRARAARRPSGGPLRDLKPDAVGHAR
jgi:hypothetical protein